MIDSCQQPNDHLGDDQPANRRSRELTELLTENYDLPRLWDRHGIVGDVIVSVIFHRTCLASDTITQS